LKNEKENFAIVEAEKRDHVSLLSLTFFGYVCINMREKEREKKEKRKRRERKEKEKRKKRESENLDKFRC